MKNTKETTFDREGYYAARNRRIVSFVLEDIALKQAIKAAADADGRSVNGYLTHYLLPLIAEKVKPFMKPSKK